MRKVEITLYKFEELSEPAQQRALEKLGDINVGYDWYENTYEDAKNIGAEIEAFDTDRGTIDFKLQHAAIAVAVSIKANHGKSTDTYAIAESFCAQWNDKVELTDDEIDANEALEKEFEEQLGWEYLGMLRREYDYLTGREAIVEMINANEYEFTSEGDLA